MALVDEVGFDSIVFHDEDGYTTLIKKYYGLVGCQTSSSTQAISNIDMIELESLEMANL